MKSYSLYQDQLVEYYNEKVNPNWSKQVKEAQAILQEESQLQEIVRLVGIDALGPYDRLKLLSAQMIREDYLQQDAFHEIDTYASPEKMFMMLEVILKFKNRAYEAIVDGKSYKDIENLPIRERIGRFKYTPEQDIKSVMSSIHEDMMIEFDSLKKE